MSFRGHRLRDIRTRRGFTQAELAERIGTNQRQIVRYETNLNDPGGDVIARLARELSVTSDYLLGLSDDPGSQLVEADLSVEEWQIVRALRSGLTIEAMRVVVSLAGATPDKGSNAG